MNTRRENRWLPSAVVASVGVVAILVGLSIGGPDALDGIVIGILAFAVAGVMFSRRVSE